MDKSGMEKLEMYRLKKREQRKKLALFCGAALLFIALIAGIVLFVLSRPYATPQKTVKAFYDAVYLDSDLSKMEQCVVEERRGEMETVFTLGGVDRDLVKIYRQTAAQYLGERFTIEYDFFDESDMPTANLNSLKGRYSGLSVGKYLKATVIFRAEDYNGAFQVELELVKQNGKWRLTRYDMLPMGTIPAID